MKLTVDPQSGKLKVPIIISYPEFRFTDKIEAANEDDALEDQLAVVFQNGLPWDTQGYYEFSKIEAYIEVTIIISDFHHNITLF